MLIKRIELENIKSYRHFAVDFRRGTTAISGENGAGKTTLVEAIGFALFDYLPYSQARFVREGEKFGRIIIHLIGGDERPYTVERRCGSGSRWFIHDEEANARMEQSADVLDKLHELFGIDRERPLDSLFRDALGVPQGTFTSIFLEAASKRKQTFDSLLQIEDYKTAADNLLEVQKVYKEQMVEQRAQIDRLSYETRELDDWRANLKAARQQDEEWKRQNEEWTQQLAQHEEHQRQLIEQQRRLQQLEQAYTTSKTEHDSACNLLANYEQQLQAAQAAEQIVNASRADHQRYLQAEDALRTLRQQEQQRNALRQQQAGLERDRATVAANCNHLQTRLDEVAAARQKVVELAPLVEQQVELERQRDELAQKVKQYETIVSEGKQLSRRLDIYRQKQAELERKIAVIKPLLPVAERLQEYTQTLTQLQVQRNERKNKQQQLQEKRGLLQEKVADQERISTDLRKAEKNIAIIEEHRSEAEEMPVLQDQYQQLAAQRHRLEGNIEGYARSKAQSAGGQCPLLNESCLNIKQRGIISLESYFEGLLTEEHAQLDAVSQQQNTLTERMGQIKKYVDALNKLDRYTDKRDTLAQQSQAVAQEIARLTQDCSAIEQDLEVLKTVDQQIKEADAAYKESKQADAQARELPGLVSQVQQYQEQIAQGEADLQERRQQAESLRGSDAQLKVVNAELATLNDPRTQSKAQQAVIAQESTHLRQLQRERERMQQIVQQLQTLQEQLAVYNTLDSEIAQQEVIRQQCQAGYQSYLKNVELALTLPKRTQIYQQQQHITEQAAQTLQANEQAFREAAAIFDASVLASVSAEIERLRNELMQLAHTLQRHQQDMNELERKIEQAEALLLELEAAQKEHQTLEDLNSMTEQFRKLIKEAAPHVLKAMLNDISAEANRIFGEIMGDRSAQLSWQNEYEVILRRQGVNRTFAQLSGGEQMSAALAVRLALLKKLSTLNLAFFDEPTQNMDELRRMNLAEQIRRVRGFEQLIVISHDDTFEQGLDSLIRLRKTDGETHLVDENGVAREVRDDTSNTIWGQQDVYASSL